MASTVLSPPKPIQVTLQSFTPRGIQHPMTPNKNKLVHRSKLMKTGAIYEVDQSVRRTLFNYPTAEVEETDIIDLMTETRERCILNTAITPEGERFILYDDYTYELMNVDQEPSTLCPNNPTYALCNATDNNE